MSFGQSRIILQPGEWAQISTSEDANVTVENFGVDAYQFVHIVSGAVNPGEDPPEHFRTLHPQRQHTFTNLDEGTVLWARALSMATLIEVLTG